jgi:hypothetical protein
MALGVVISLCMCVALVEEPESEFGSHSEVGPYVTVIEEPGSGGRTQVKTCVCTWCRQGNRHSRVIKVRKIPFPCRVHLTWAYWRVATKLGRITSCRSASVTGSPILKTSRRIGCTVVTSTEIMGCSRVHLLRLFVEFGD